MEEGKKEGKKPCFSVLMVVCIFMILGLDIFAGILGLQAEAAQQNVKHHRVWLLECKAPSKRAFLLGIIALACLVGAHIIANLIGCSVSNLVKAFAGVPNITGYFNVACLGLTWIVGIVGAGILMMGIWSNRASRSECGITNKHFLSLGGKVCFVHAIVSVVFYLSNIIAKQSCCF